VDRKDGIETRVEFPALKLYWNIAPCVVMGGCGLFNDSESNVTIVETCKTAICRESFEGFLQKFPTEV
jgi:hypothetical protein